MVQNPERAGVGSAVANPAEALDPMLRLLLVISRSERKARLDRLRQAMFELLKQGGYERVEVEFDGYQDEGQVEGMSFFKAGSEVPPEAVPFGHRDAVEQYVYATLPGGWETNGGCFGTVRIYPGSEFAHFDHTRREVWWEPFNDGEPGAEVPEWDRLEELDDE